MKTTALHFAICWLLSLPAVAVGGEIFDFMVDDGNGGKFAFARLELAKLPARLDDFVSLSLSDAAQEKFGFGFELYPGTFDDMSPPENGPRFISDRSGGLTGTDGDAVNGVRIRDFMDIPASSLPNVDTLSIFNVSASSILQLRDEMSLRFRTPTGESVVVIQTGDFVQVPEPSSQAICCAGIAALVFYRRTKRRYAIPNKLTGAC